jgi:selenium metabolism protein YedF
LKKTIDARGKSCPQPVVMTKTALEALQTGALTVVVDNITSCENVERFARSQGCTVKVEQREDGYSLDVVKGGPYRERVPREAGEGPVPSAEARIVVYIGSDQMGSGEKELGRILLRAFLRTLKDATPRPEKLIFINSGVKLTTEGSDLIDSIRELELMNVTVLSCGTCLEFYHLKDKLKVGVVSNMYEIASSLLEADRIIRP